MNKYTIIIAQVCAALLALIVMVLLALGKGGNKADADGVPPEVDTHGLCVVEVAEPEYEMYFTETDVIALAQMHPVKSAAVRMVCLEPRRRCAFP